MCRVEARADGVNVTEFRQPSSAKELCNYLASGGWIWPPSYNLRLPAANGTVAEILDKTIIPASNYVLHKAVYTISVNNDNTFYTKRVLSLWIRVGKYVGEVYSEGDDTISWKF